MWQIYQQIDTQTIYKWLTCLEHLKETKRIDNIYNRYWYDYQKWKEKYSNQIEMSITSQKGEGK